MRNPDDFDEFYKDSRDRLLLQTYALTGDLRASRSAVRDAYVIAWHHWRKINRQPDREAWLRPLAMTDARRRHGAKILHRDRGLGPDAKATLEALQKLPLVQRRILILTQLAITPMAEIAREVGVPQVDAERLLQTAASSFSLHRGIASSQLRAELTALAAVTDNARLPRASIVRRAGAARRRAFTAVGVGTVVVALLGAGSFVSDDRGVAPSLGADAVRPGEHNQVLMTLDSADLLTTEQVGSLAPGPWTASPGAANTDGDGINTPCQPDRYADPAGLGSMVRRFDHAGSKREPAISAVQATELSRSPRTAASTYATTVQWYAGCATPGVHLLAAYDVTGVGNRASLLVLRRTGRGATSTYTVGVARSGHLTTTVFNAVDADQKPPVQPLTKLLSAAVTRLCGADGAGTCTGTAQAHRAPPPAVGETPGLLDVIDLPAPGRITKPWTAAEARRATGVNLATVACDDTTFNKAPVTHGQTRSYLILQAGLVDRFGITESVGTLPTPREARRFMNGVRKGMAKCEDNFLASTVTRLTDRSGTATELVAWHVTTEVSDQGAVDVLMAIVRRGPQVGQVGFVTARGASYDKATFLALAARAIERLAYLSPPKKS